MVHIPDGSAVPACTAVHVPAEPLGGLQVSQTPLHALSQQTPSRELQVRPAMHWAVAEQVPPFGSRPHEPPAQLAGAVHCASVVQMLVQARAAGSHRPGAQATVAGATQIPAPSHLATGFWVEAVGQLAPAHWLPAAHFAHCPALHEPVVPQVDTAWAGQRPFGSSPLAMLVQTPREAGRVQAWQAAVQAELQQIPETQWACRHWVSDEQAAPSGDWPQTLPTQV